MTSNLLDPSIPQARSARWQFWHQREPEQYMGYLFALPAVLIIVVFRLYPLVSGAQYSLTDWNGIGEAHYIGLDNYERLLHDQVFRDTMLNALKLIVTLPIWVIFPMVLAILIHQGVPGGGFFRAAYFFPAVLSSVIIGSIFNLFLRYDGSFNNMLGHLGIPAVDWLSDSKIALFTVIAVEIWATFGINVLIFLSGLSTVPDELIDAAKVDGANLFQTVVRVIIPVLRPITEFVSVATIIGMLTSMFGLIYVMTSGGPGTATYLPEYLIWFQQGRLNEPAYAAATSMVLFVFMSIVALFEIRLMSRGSDM
ncbi:MAG TPA: sugar ABC transporter permease [Aggregatilinea sp.]|uniref:carbohydrate ABC transporter permease n=1 Tax=Aggregatilinea sp. TaxID=2806333 RepID=UPI002D09358E|nr:sugar ABC transporter permease [Aggregatilinea sp.]HML24796.1 sugar ABC transporter permease [Aggregatilinea sp.]